jgi:hypothetical protein
VFGRNLGVADGRTRLGFGVWQQAGGGERNLPEERG